MQPHRMYVGTIGEGIWRSLDSGENFTRAADGMFVECYVRALAVHPRDDRTIYAGTEAGLYRTTNGADDWQRIASPLDGQEVWSILVPPGQPDTIVVGTRPSHIYRSTDAGRTWQESKVVIRQDCPRIISTRVTTLKADPEEPNLMWAGVEIDGLFKSTDAGASWERASSTGLVSQDIHDLAILHAGAKKVMLVATNADLHRSTDAGQTWRPLDVKGSLPWSYCRALAQPLGRLDTVLLGSGNGPPGTAGIVGMSRRDGLDWQPARFPGHSNSTIWNFAVHKADPNLVYASSVSGEVYRSTDGGLTWEKLSREFGEIRALAWTP